MQPVSGLEHGSKKVINRKGLVLVSTVQWGSQSSFVVLDQGDLSSQNYSELPYLYWSLTELTERGIEPGTMWFPGECTADCEKKTQNIFNLPSF